MVHSQPCSIHLAQSPGSPAEAKEELKRFERNSEERQSWASMRIQNPQDL